MTDAPERVSVTLYLTPDSLQVLREASKRLGLTQNPQGSASAIVQRLVDRLEREDDPFGANTLEESVFRDMLMIAEAIQHDCSGTEDETVAVLRIAAERIYDGLPSHIIPDAIEDVRTILFS